MEERQARRRRPHCLVLVFPTQGHVNPMLQFSKRLDHKGVRVTLVVSHFLRKTLQFESTTSIALESISDGYDDGGITVAESDKGYIDRFWDVGPKSFEELLQKLTSCGDSIECVVYDSVLRWALDIAKKFGAIGASFFTHSCAVNSIYYHVYCGNLKIPVTDDDESEVLLPGLPPLASYDLPSLLHVWGTYPAFTDMVVNRFYDIQKADWLLCNTFYELEPQVVEWQAKIFPLKTIGPTIPSTFLDKRLKDDHAYGFSFYKEEDEACMKWLNDKISGSVVYVSFGSLAALNAEQMEEMAWGLKDSVAYFLWVVRESEKHKLPKGFLEISRNKGLVVTWCPQLQVLNHESVGCFVTHCGWNSTLEAVSLGVPMVGVPQWTDQPTDAKYIQDVWKIGVKAEADEEGIVRRETVKKCIEEVMHSERGKEMKMNALKLKSLSLKACEEGGSSDKNIDDFVASLLPLPNSSEEE